MTCASQSRPDCCLAFRVKVLQSLQVIHSWFSGGLSKKDRTETASRVANKSLAPPTLIHVCVFLKPKSQLCETHGKPLNPLLILYYLRSNHSVGNRKKRHTKRQTLTPNPKT